MITVTQQSNVPSEALLQYLALVPFNFSDFRAKGDAQVPRQEFEGRAMVCPSPSLILSSSLARCALDVWKDTQWDSLCSGESGMVEWREEGVDLRWNDVMVDAPQIAPQLQDKEMAAF